MARESLQEVRAGRQQRPATACPRGHLGPTRNRRSQGSRIATLDDFRAALEARSHRIKRAGKAFSTTCPAHEDRNASLSFGEGDRTELVATCHAGCTFEAILAALGLDEPTRAPEPRQEIDATYDYVDEAGVPLYQAVRYRNPKGFKQRRRVGDGWQWGLGDVRRVLYELPIVRAAIENKPTTVFVVEGEKDVAAIESVGFVATCSPMGAGKWRDEYVESLKGAAAVVAVADCDEPGRQHARDVCASVYAAGIQARFVDLAPDRDDGYDVSDFVAEHGDEKARELLQILARRARPWPQAQLPPLPILSIADFLAGIPPYDETKDYLGPFLHGGYRIHVAGPIGHGKTSFLMEAVSSALRGDEFLGWRGKGGRLRGLYVDLEMPAELLGQAVRDARLDKVGDRFQMMHLPDGLEIDTNPRHREMIERAVEGFDLVVFDPWYKLLGNELEYASGRSVIAVFDGIRNRHPDMCVLIGFHAQEPIPPDAPITMGNVSGFKFFQRPADIVVTFQRMHGDRSRLRWEKNRSPRLKVKKGDFWSVEWERGSGFRFPPEDDDRES